jgi:hypothetical protein
MPETYLLQLSDSESSQSVPRHDIEVACYPALRSGWTPASAGHLLRHCSGCREKPLEFS